MDKIIGLVLVGIAAFAAVICAYRFCYAKDKDEIGGLLVFGVFVASCVVGFVGLVMASGQ